MKFFEYVLKDGFSKVTDRSMAKCIAEKGTDQQNDFALTKNLIMKKAWDEIKKVSVADAKHPDWDAYLAQVKTHLDRAIETAEDQLTSRKANATETEPATGLDIKDVTAYVRSMEQMFVELNTLFELRLFSPHRDSNSKQYTSSNKTVSPWFNQFINLCLTYKVQKLIPIIVDGNRETIAYVNKWDLLKSTAEQWSQLDTESRKEDTAITSKSMNKSINDMLTILAQQESFIQNQGRKGKVYVAANSVWGFFQSNLSPYIPIVGKGSSLEPLVTAFKSRFEDERVSPPRTSQILATTP